eukprot:TRINITY_DN13351_c0_g1_i2.p1 TRINITY_DN13351_c0_g1~~TRINITY_DN13351_c0_g1_i2.p1  ORF type:complete len:228 (+),score=24.30 TRINITY_DN13351_c0_g1_i2:65-748(+)
MNYLTPIENIIHRLLRYGTEVMKLVKKKTAVFAIFSICISLCFVIISVGSSFWLFFRSSRFGCEDNINYEEHYIGLLSELTCEYYCVNNGEDSNCYTNNIKDWENGFLKNLSEILLIFIFFGIVVAIFSLIISIFRTIDTKKLRKRRNKFIIGSLNFLVVTLYTSLNFCATSIFLVSYFNHFFEEEERADLGWSFYTFVLSNIFNFLALVCIYYDYIYHCIDIKLFK